MGDAFALRSLSENPDSAPSLLGSGANFGDRAPEGPEAVQIVFVDPDRRALALWVDELIRSGVPRGSILTCTDASTALASLPGEARLVAFVSWSLGDADIRPLMQSMRARGAYVVALVPPNQRSQALAAGADGVEDVVFTPCRSEAVVARALLAADAVRRSRPAPWHRPRAALQEALRHADGGEVVVRRQGGTSRILVSRGRIAWVDDDADRGTLIARLRAHGVDVTSEDLANVIAEARRTNEHFADVLSGWGLADSEAVERAVRGIVDARLAAAMAQKDATALFLPATWSDSGRMGFPAEQLGSGRSTVPPSLHSTLRLTPVSFEGDVLASMHALADDVLALDGCVVSAVLHYGSASVVCARGDADRLALAWSLGAVLDELDDPAADALVNSGARCHVARPLPGTECFVYAAFDPDVASVALARRTVALAVEHASVANGQVTSADAPAPDRAPPHRHSLSRSPPTPDRRNRTHMADIKGCLNQILKLDGALGAALVDYESGMCLGIAGNPGFDLEIAAASNTEVVRAKKSARDRLGLKDKIEDILITLTGQYHLIRMVGTTMFYYVVLDRAKSNLALARKELAAVEAALDIARG